VALILVRHALPEVVRGVPSSQWGLSDAGREDCVLLAHALPAELAPVVYSSGIPKAAETAAVIALRRGLRTAVDRRLREVDQPPGWVEDHRAKVLGYLAGRDGFDWEPRDRAVERFGAAIRDALAADAGRAGDTVVVAHGLVMTLWVATFAKIDPGAWWEALTLPDAWRVEAWSVARVGLG
jgi:broad specificity phosphatase PhoE